VIELGTSGRRAGHENVTNRRLNVLEDNKRRSNASNCKRSKGWGGEKVNNNLIYTLRGGAKVEQ